MIEVDKSWNHPFSVASHWWLPERPDDRIAGTINYENGAIRVELLGTLESCSVLDIDVELPLIPIVHGESFNDRFTLLNCRTVGQNSRFGITNPGSAVKSTLDVSIAMVGAIFPNVSSLQFNCAAVRFHGLESWVNDNPVTRRIPAPNDQGFDRSYALPDDRVIPSSTDNSTLTISSQYQSTMIGRDDTFTFQNVLFLESNSPLGHKWFLERANSLSSLLSFLTGRQTGISHFSLETPTNSDDANNSPASCRVYVRHFPFEPKNELGILDMRYSYPMLVDRFPVIVDKWLSRSDQLETAFDLVAGAQLDKDLPVRFQFLNLIHALECLDRAKGNRVYISEESYQPFRQQISNAIPTELGSKNS